VYSQIISDSVAVEIFTIGQACNIYSVKYDVLFWDTVYSHQAFRQYLLGRKFIIRTDHAALVWLKRIPEPIDQNATSTSRHNIELEQARKRWCKVYISEYPCLNRPSCTACQPEINHCRAMEIEGPPFQVSSPIIPSVRVRTSRKNNAHIEIWMSFWRWWSAARSTVKLLSSETKKLWNEWQRLVIKDNVLRRSVITISIWCTTMSAILNLKVLSFLVAGFLLLYYNLLQHTRFNQNLMTCIEIMAK